MTEDRLRQHLGCESSAALPMAWAEMRRRSWKPADLARELKEDGAKIARLLYGDRKPGRRFSVKLRDVLGIPIEAWDQPIPKGWLPHGPERRRTGTDG
jgi:hypothetical protein